MLCASDMQRENQIQWPFAYDFYKTRNEEFEAFVEGLNLEKTDKECHLDTDDMLTPLGTNSELELNLMTSSDSLLRPYIVKEEEQSFYSTSLEDLFLSHELRGGHEDHSYSSDDYSETFTDDDDSCNSSINVAWFSGEEIYFESHDQDRQRLRHDMEEVDSDIILPRPNGRTSFMLGSSPLRPYACPFTNCNAAFRNKPHLREHMRIHTGEKPYQCPFQGCSKSFRHKCTLTVHIRQHTGERPYACDISGCGKAFMKKSALVSHRKRCIAKRNYGGRVRK